MKLSKERIIFLVATLLIVLVLGIFWIGTIIGNPLEGEWKSETNGFYLDIDDEGEAELRVTVKETPVDVDLFYTIDKKAKTITFKGDLESFGEEAKESDGKLGAADIDEYLEAFLRAFDYSLDNRTLTLTDRENGEQFIFAKMK